MKDTIREYFAVTPPGLEDLCVREMIQLGLVPQEQIHGGIAFSGGLRELYLANLSLRTASRVLVRLGRLTARDFPSLYQRLVRLPWGRYIKPGDACDVRVVSHRSRLSHSGRIAEVCQEAIARALGAAPGQGAVCQTVLLRLEEDRVDVSLDSSGEHLHRRGYRRARSAAPLRENLAAAALLACGYDGTLPLIDIMTGSGTFVTEAALIALHRAPGQGRRFAFMHWPKYREGLWQQLLGNARDEARDVLPAPILGIDSNPRALDAARQNIASAGLEGQVEIRCEQLQQLEPLSPTGLLIGNPPYGARLGKSARLQGFYAELEDLCAGPFAAWQTALLCPAEVVQRMRRVDFQPLLRFSHGGIKVGLYLKKPVAVRGIPLTCDGSGSISSSSCSDQTDL
ncbi:MAG: RNA methyltransferase [Pelovirga sp.]